MFGTSYTQKEGNVGVVLVGMLPSLILAEEKDGERAPYNHPSLPGLGGTRQWVSTALKKVSWGKVGNLYIVSGYYDSSNIFLGSNYWYIIYDYVMLWRYRSSNRYSVSQWTAAPSLSDHLRGFVSIRKRFLSVYILMTLVVW